MKQQFNSMNIGIICMLTVLFFNLLMLTYTTTATFTDQTTIPAGIKLELGTIDIEVGEPEWVVEDRVYKTTVKNVGSVEGKLAYRIEQTDDGTDITHTVSAFVLNESGDRNPFEQNMVLPSGTEWTLVFEEDENISDLIKAEITFKLFQSNVNDSSSGFYDTESYEIEIGPSDWPQVFSEGTWGDFQYTISPSITYTEKNWILWKTYERSRKNSFLYVTFPESVDAERVKLIDLNATEEVEYPGVLEVDVGSAMYSSKYNGIRYNIDAENRSDSILSEIFKVLRGATNLLKRILSLLGHKDVHVDSPFELFIGFQDSNSGKYIGVLGLTMDQLLDEKTQTFGAMRHSANGINSVKQNKTEEADHELEDVKGAPDSDSKEEQQLLERFSDTEPNLNNEETLSMNNEKSRVKEFTENQTEETTSELIEENAENTNDDSKKFVEDSIEQTDEIELEKPSNEKDNEVISKEENRDVEQPPLEEEGNITFMPVSDFNDNPIGLPHFFWEWLDQSELEESLTLPQYVQQFMEKNPLDPEADETSYPILEVQDDTLVVNTKLDRSKISSDVSEEEIVTWLNETTGMKVEIKEANEDGTYLISFTSLE
ncbi:hypothetical protein [Atopococcus tabaci]|uniref:hypothetical protein n=1 Tax=Atopococcus tabaci TaxID=269774 RepID=UPI00041EBD78|nr:hypothetical protein [Atopococcus tabaci]